MNQQKLYLVLDSGSVPLAHCLLESPAEAEDLYIRVSDENEFDTVLEHELVQLVPLSPGMPGLLGRIIRSRNDIIVIKKQKTLGEDVRESLRVPADFDTFIYPVTGSWVGRRRARANDLSCRGIAFFSEEPLEKGERLEIVIPVRGGPLILCCEILRERASPVSVPMYAAKFVDMCHDEESLVCEAVFSAQIAQHRS